MALANARLTDRFVGVCCCHPPIPCIGTGGLIVKGMATHTSGNLLNARLTDTVLGDCGHTGMIITSSGTVSSGNLLVARLSDGVGAGCIVSGVIVGGHATHSVG